jgi:hypothetical protein
MTLGKWVEATFVMLLLDERCTRNRRSFICALCGNSCVNGENVLRAIFLETNASETGFVVKQLKINCRKNN